MALSVLETPSPSRIGWGLPRNSPLMFERSGEVLLKAPKRLSVSTKMFFTKPQLLLESSFSLVLLSLFLFLNMFLFTVSLLPLLKIFVKSRPSYHVTPLFPLLSLLQMVGGWTTAFLGSFKVLALTPPPTPLPAPSSLLPTLSPALGLGLGALRPRKAARRQSKTATELRSRLPSGPPFGQPGLSPLPCVNWKPSLALILRSASPLSALLLQLRTSVTLLPKIGLPPRVLMVFRSPPGAPPRT